MLKKVTFEGIHERKAQRMEDCYGACHTLCVVMCNITHLAFQDQFDEEVGCEF